MNFRFRSNVFIRARVKMSQKLIAIAILFVSIYQLMQLCQATPPIFPVPEEPPTPSNTNDDSTPEELPTPVNTNDDSAPEEPSTPSNTNDNSAPEQPPTPSNTNDTPNLTPTDPAELNKMAFSPLLQLYGKIGPMIYTLLTEKNALGDQMSVVSKLIVDRIGLENYTEDMNLIFSNALNPEVSKKILDVYDQIKEVQVQGTTDRKLKDAAEIITNIFNDDDAVDEIIKVIKTGEV